jgi:2-polyprenyl-3-methyl-5-hydroxy-6-metoxy-1,4-benzoquinol methylase
LVIDDSGDVEFHKSVEALSSIVQLEVKVSPGPGRGLGEAILRGFAIALDNSNIDFIINLDADGQHDGRQIGDLIRAHYSSGNDITIGSRWTRGGKCYGLSIARVFVSRCSSLVLRLNGVPWHIKDPTTSFRVYSREAINTVSRELAGFGGFSFFGAAIAFADKSGLTVREVPIHFRPRLAGNSNLKGAQVLRAIKDLRRIGAAAAMISRRRQKQILNSDTDNEQSHYAGLDDLKVLSKSTSHIEGLLDEILPHTGQSVLEIGAGVGAITTALATKGRAVTACEPNAELFSILEQNTNSIDAKLFYGNLCGFDIHMENANKFDSILYINVLEHIKDDIKELILAKSLIAPQGNLVILVPATPSLYSTLDAKSGHVRRYRKQELAAVINSAGLRVSNIHYVDPVGCFAYWFLFRVCRVKNISPQVVSINSSIISPLSRIVSRISRNALPGRFLVAVAETT